MKGEFKDDTFLARWLNNELSEEELKHFQASSDYSWYQKIISGTELISAPGFDEEQSLQTLKEKGNISGGKSKKLSLSWVYGVAASLLLAAAIYVFVLDREPVIQTAEASYGQTKNIELPDGSDVILNSRSTISYSSDWDEERVLQLAGEAYFQVETGNKFTVETRLGDVTVLGTAFNVLVVNGYLEVICYEGKVSVSSNDGVSQILTPGKVFRQIEGQSYVDLATGEREPAWLGNESSFQSVPIKYVLIALEKQFNIKFEGTTSNNDSTFTGTFPHDDLDVALKVVLGSLQIDYQLKEDRTVLLED